MYCLANIVYQILLVLCLRHDITINLAKCKEEILLGVDYDKLELSEGDLPIILWWTGRLYSRGDKSLGKITCPSSTCLSTRNRKYLSHSRTRALLFYGTDIDVSDLPLPRHSSHEWALFHEESPMNKYMLVHGTTLSLFNHTATFRRESHFPITSQHIPSVDYLTERKPISVEQKNLFRKEGIAPIAYIQSHCDVASDRDRYVMELMKYIAIDSYGTCVNNKEMPPTLTDPVESMHSDDFLDFISQYKFILSFENAICKDYMTEKLFRTLHVGSVPIYKGSSHVQDWMPDEKSVIVVDNYNTPKELAEYILYLDENDYEYSKYLNYKLHGISNNFLQNALEHRVWSTYGVIPHPIYASSKPDMLNAFQCYVCDEISARLKHEYLMAINPQLEPLEPKMAEVSHLHCPQPYTSIGDPGDLSRSDSWIESTWIDDYWSGLDKGQALLKMILKKETDPSKFHQYLDDIYKENPRPHS